LACIHAQVKIGVFMRSLLYSLLLVSTIFAHIPSKADTSQDIDGLIEQAIRFKQGLVKFADQYGTRSVREQTFTLEGRISGFAGGIFLAGVSGQINAKDVTLLEDAEIITINVVYADQIKEFLTQIQTVEGALNGGGKLKQSKKYSDSWVVETQCTQKVIQEAQNLSQSKNVLLANHQERIATLYNYAAQFKDRVRDLEKLVHYMDSKQKPAFDRLAAWGQLSRIIVDVYYAKNYATNYETAAPGIFQFRDNSYWIQARIENAYCRPNRGTGEVEQFHIMPAESLEISVRP
jgi:hypothetical protein